MERKRIKLEVWVDLDPVSGTFSTPEGAQVAVKAILNESIPWYKPGVNIPPEDIQAEFTKGK